MDVKFWEWIKRIINQFTDKVLEELGVKKDKKESLKALLNLSFSLVFKDNNFDKECDDYSKSLRIFSKSFEIGKEKVKLIFDILSGDPYRIFGMETKKLSLVNQGLKLHKDVKIRRLNLISDCFKISEENMKRIFALWIYFHNIIRSSFSPEENVQNINSIELLATEVLGIDSNMFNILMKYKQANGNLSKQNRLREDMSEFVWASLIKSRDNVKGELPFIKHFKKEISDELKELFNWSIRKMKNKMTKVLLLLSKLVYEKDYNTFKKAANIECNKSFLRLAGKLIDHGFKDSVLVLRMIERWFNHQSREEEGKRWESFIWKYYLPCILLINGNILIEGLLYSFQREWTC